MKHRFNYSIYLLIILFIVIKQNGFSQIPNPSFESVTSGKPNGWNLGIVYGSYPIRDTAVPHSGNHAVAFYGSIPPTYNGALAQNFTQISNKPLALTGWYRFYPQNGDSILFDVEVWKQGNYATRAKNSLTTTILTGTTTVFTQFSVSINYAGYGFTTCDSAFISIYPTGNVSQGGYNWAHPNTKAIFDDLAWTFSPTGVEEINLQQLVNVESTSPNPTESFVNIIYTVGEPANISLKLNDLLGKEVLVIVDHEPQLKGRYKAVADLSELPSGIYFYEFITSSGYKITKKLIKQ